MRCAQVRRALSAFLDGEVPEAQRLAIASHLEGCALCRAERETLAAAWDALLLSPEAPAAPCFEDRLRQRIAAREIASPALTERLRGVLWIPTRRLVIAGALAGIAAGWGVGRAPVALPLREEPAGLVRLRPILMTALVGIIGLLPLALGLGEGTELLKPMAIAVIGGLIFSVFLTLFFLPALYLAIAGGQPGKGLDPEAAQEEESVLVGAGETP